MSQWPHAPAHWLIGPGLYIVTTGTHGTKPHLNTPERRDYFLQALFGAAAEFAWELHAWAVLNNHYHWVARATENSGPLKRMLGKLHMTTAKELNLLDGTPGRKVWFQYWDTLMTDERAYLARLNYVHHNPVKHGVVAQAANYRWCSAAWFAENATPAFRATVESFKIDQVNVPDEF